MNAPKKFVYSTEGKDIQVWVPRCPRPARVGGGSILQTAALSGCREEWNTYISESVLFTFSNPFH